MGSPSDVSSAQNFEDVRLWRVLHDCPDTFFVDVGANHPTKFSVTKWFSDRGWSGINIEPGPDFVALCADRPHEINLDVAIGAENGSCDLVVPDRASGRASTNPENARDPNVRAVSPTETTFRVQQRRLADVLAEHADGRGIAFLSVDVEGAEAEVLASNDWSRFRPRVVVVEAIDPIDLLPDHHGWEPILLEQGYRYAVADGINRFYVAEEHPGLLERFDLDFVGRFMDSDPKRMHEAVTRTQRYAAENAALVEQLEATKRSAAFRVGHVALAPMRALRWGSAALRRRRNR